VLLAQVLLAAVMSALLAMAPQVQIIGDDEIRWETKPFIPNEMPTVRVQTNLVQVPVVVRDVHGQPVGTFTQTDFELLDNGRPQIISTFAVEQAPPRAPEGTAAPQSKEPPSSPGSSAPPRYVVLYFDDANLSLSDLEPVQKAAEQVVREGVQVGDRVGVFTTSGNVALEPTGDTGKILDAIKELRSQQKLAMSANSCPRMGIYQAHLIYDMRDPNATALAIADGNAQKCLPRSHAEEIVLNTASAVLAFAEQLSQTTMDRVTDAIRYLSKFPGHKTLVLMSAGFFTMTLHARQEKLMSDALKSSVVINSLDARGLYAEIPIGGPSGGLSQPVGPPLYVGNRPPGSGPAIVDMGSYVDSLAHQQAEIIKDPLSLLAEGTGGRFFQNNNDFKRGIQELASAPDVFYTLGFQPGDMKPDGQYHSLKVQLLSKRGYTVEARKGYYAPTTKELAEQEIPGDASRKLTSAVMGTEIRTDIPGELETKLEKTASGGPQLIVSMHVDLSGLSYTKRDDRSVQRLVFVAALFDNSGRIVAGFQRIADLSLKDATRARITQQGLDASVPLQAAPGSYRLRVVVEEMGRGGISALTQPVEIQ
jgi:VWFA-related protein